MCLANGINDFLVETYLSLIGVPKHSELYAEMRSDLYQKLDNSLFKQKLMAYVVAHRSDIDKHKGNSHITNENDLLNASPLELDVTETFTKTRGSNSCSFDALINEHLVKRKH